MIPAILSSTVLKRFPHLAHVVPPRLGKDPELAKDLGAPLAVKVMRLFILEQLLPEPMTEIMKMLLVGNVLQKISGEKDFRRFSKEFFMYWCEALDLETTTLANQLLTRDVCRKV